MANLLNFKFGLHGNLPAASSDSLGTVYITTDEQAMYVDLPKAAGSTEVNRVRIGDIIVLANATEAKPPFSVGFYYFADENALMRWDGTSWKQINTTAQVEATVKALTKTVNDEIARSTAADTKHTADIKANADAIAQRVTKTEFTTFQESNTAAIADAKKEGTEAKAAAATAQATAETAGKSASNAMAEAQKMLPKSGGTMTGAINMNGKAITNVLAPSDGADAANKTYVDNAKSAALEAASGAKSAADTAQARADAAYSKAEAGVTAADNAQAKANSAYDLAAEKATLDDVKALNYATKSEAQGYANAVLGTSTDDKDDVTVYGARAAAADALAKANAAQQTANGKVTMAQVEAKNYATKTEAQNMANAVLGTNNDTSAENTVYGAKKAATEALAKAQTGVDNAATAQAAASGAQASANSAMTAAQTAQGAADKAQEDATQALADAKAADDNAKTRVLTTDFEAFKTSNTSEIAKAKAAGDAAQGTADTALSKANTAQGTADQAVKDAKAASDLAATMLPKAGGTMTGAIAMSNKKITGLAAPTDNADAANKAYVDAAETAAKADAATAKSTADTALGKANAALPKAGGTMSGAIAMGSNKITGLAGPSDNADAANKKYVDDAVKAGIAASDAMVYKGVIGSQSALSAITTANKGDTYKISTAFTVGTVKYKVGDIIINSGADGAAPTWDHITSGYEDDYLQKLAADTTNATVHLTDGVTNTATGSVSGIKFVGAETSNIVMSVTAGTGNNPVHTVTASMVWGEF